MGRGDEWIQSCTLVIGDIWATQGASCLSDEWLHLPRSFSSGLSWTVGSMQHEGSLLFPSSPGTDATNRSCTAQKGGGTLLS